MTRKRFVKLLMRIGLDRQQSNMFACYAKYYGNYQEMFNDVFLFFITVWRIQSVKPVR